MKKVRWKIVVPVALGSLLLLYLGGGVAASFIVTASVFSSPGKSIEDLDKIDSLVYKQAKDFDEYAGRETLTIEKEDRKLALYRTQNPLHKGAVLAVHGMKSNSDDSNAIYQHFLYEKGYDVYALDLSSCGRSEGSVSGLHQAAYDVKSAYDYLNDFHYLTEGKPLILIGHSWGAYGVAASLSLGVKADYLIAMSAFLSPEKAMMQYARNYAGAFADMTSPPFQLTMNLRYGSDFHLDSASGIASGITKKSLILHGELDKSIPLNNTSLYQNIEESEKVTKVLLPEIGHNTPWLSKQAVEYANSVLEEAKKGGEPSASLMDLDKERSSELNPVFVDAVNALLP